METLSSPKGGIDYPRTLAEFDRWFVTDEQCLAYLIKLRWPDGFVCPDCRGRTGWLTARGLYRCAGCDQQVSPTAGTIFQGTRKPLRVWFQVIWHVMSQKNGVSAKSLEAAFGFGSYQTAWAWLHKLRRAMVRPDRDELAGVVEVDVTYVGGAEAGIAGRKTNKKALVAIAAELDENRIARIRLQRVRNAGKAELQAFVQNTIKEGSIVRTDAWPSYDGIEHLGYIRDEINLSAISDPAHAALPHVHRIAALLKRWWLGTHQGAITPRHLDFYLDEFTFRFNRRRSLARGLLFYRLLEQAVATDHTTYQQILGGRGQKALRKKRTNPRERRRPARRVSVSLPLGTKAPPHGRWSSNRLRLPVLSSVRTLADEG